VKANEYLSQVYNLKRKIKYNLVRLEELREMSCSISAPAWDKVPSGNRCTEAPFVKVLERIWEKEEEINREMAELERLEKEIQAVIEALTDVDERYVLLYRYMQGMKWEQVALEMNRCESSVRKIHAKALRKIRVPS
jgi:DNA-directed RNA polymerase specialized sigma24 family protein